MNSILAHYIVLGARIWEVIHLDIVLHALADETEAVLPDNHRVHCSLADQELALEILSLVDEAGLCIALGVDLRIVHISFAVHYLIPLPVDYRSSGNCHLEDLRIVGDERDSHKSTITPAVYSDSVLIHIREAHEHLYAFHLVSHFRLTALAVDSLLEGCTSVGCTSVVLDINEVTPLSHVHLPSSENEGLRIRKLL